MLSAARVICMGISCAEITVALDIRISAIARVSDFIVFIIAETDYLHDGDSTMRHVPSELTPFMLLQLVPSGLQAYLPSDAIFANV